MLEFAGVHHRFGRHPSLLDISLTVAEGQFVCLIGPNGAGKSTLLRLASGLLTPSEGEVRWKGQLLRSLKRAAMARQLGFVPQQTTVDFPFTVREVVMMGRAPHQNLLGVPQRRDEEVVSEVLTTLDLEALADRPVTALSGGEAQRTLLGAALAQEPELLILDEPTSHLDVRFALRLLETLAHRNREYGTTVLLSMHDINLVAWFAHRLVVLQSGRLLQQGTPAEVMTSAGLEAAFGVPIEVQYMGPRKVPQLWVSPQT